MKLKDIKVGGIYKPVSDHCISFNDSNGVYVKITSIKDHNSFYYDILDENKEVITHCWWCFTAEDLEPVTSRSSIGKKAYKTFLKNGGKRDEKGRFSKSDFETEWFSYLDRVVANVMLNGTTEKIRKETINWDEIEEEMINKYINQKYNKKNFATAAAKVFKKHNLLKEGVEI